MSRSWHQATISVGAIGMTPAMPTRRPCPISQNQAQR